MDLKDDEEIIFCNSAKIKCKKAFFYNDPFFIDRLKLVSPSLKALGNKIPTKDQLDKAYQYQAKECQIELPNQIESRRVCQSDECETLYRIKPTLPKACQNLAQHQWTIIQLPEYRGDRSWSNNYPTSKVWFAKSE